MKKKIIALLLCVAMATTAVACGKDKKDGEVAGTENAGELTGSATIEYNSKDYVKLGTYNGMEIELTTDYSVSDSDVEEYINNNVIANYPLYADTDKETVEDGDYVNLDYTGTKDGEEFGGGSATDFVLGMNVGTVNFIDGFVDGMIGMKVGEEKDLNLTFPEDYSTADLAGADVVFHVKVNKIVEPQDISYNNLTDEYMTYISEQAGMTYENGEALIADIKSYLESSSASQKDSAIRSAVISKLLEESTIDKLPEGLLDARVSEMIEQYKTYYCSDGTELKDYVETNFGVTYDEFLTQIEGEVEQDIQTQLILETIADAEGIKFVEADFDEYVASLVSSNSLDSADALYQNYGPSVESGKNYLQRVFVCNQSLQFVVDNVKVTENIPADTEAATEDVIETEQ